MSELNALCITCDVRDCQRVKNINKKQKIQFYLKWPPLHLITASNLLQTPSDAACSCSCGISFHAQRSEHFKSSTA